MRREVWLDGVAGKGWLVVTRDRRIRYKVNEQAAAVRAGLHLFVFAQGSIKAAQTAQTLVRAYPAMLRASVVHRGAVVSLPASGRRRVAPQDRRRVAERVLLAEAAGSSEVSCW